MLLSCTHKKNELGSFEFYLGAEISKNLEPFRTFRKASFFPSSPLKCYRLTRSKMKLSVQMYIT